MFQNLIESTTHHLETKRRATFLAGTTALYALLLTVGGIASVYAYDAHLENQNLELVSLVAPVTPETKPEPDKPRQSPQVKASDDRQVPTVTELNTMDPRANPSEIKAVAHNVAPPDIKGARLGRINSVPQNRAVEFSDADNSGPANPSGNADTPPPPPPPVVKPTPQPVAKATPQPQPTPAAKPPAVVSKGVITGQATSLPKPNYPAIAKAAGASGVVQVQVTLDEGGRVISARAVSGHPLLQAAAVSAAYQARFTPTVLSGQPVKVTGFINYNFTK